MARQDKELSLREMEELSSDFTAFLSDREPGENGFPLSDEDEAILDRAWETQAQEEDR